jgi:O-antigen/teichoic acid export membrane protein
MTLYSKGQARRSVFHTAVWRVLSQLTTVAGYAVLVRGMSEHSFGVLSILYGVIPVISTFASFGVEQTLRRYQPEYLQAGNPRGAAWLLRVAAFTRFGTNLILLTIILLLWRWIAPLFHLEDYRAEFMLFCVLIFLHFQASILQISLSSYMRQGASVGVTLVLSAAKLAGYVILTYLQSLTLMHAIAADIVAYALMYAGLRIASYKYCTPPSTAPAFKLDAGERRRLLRYSLFNNFNDAGTMLLTSKTDNLFIAALANPVAAGAYSFYLRLNEMSTQLLPTQQFGNVIVPMLFAVPRQEAAVRLPRYFTLLMNLSSVVQIPIAAYTLVYHAEIVMVLFGGKFLDSSWLLPLIVGFATLNRIGEPATMLAQYEEKAGTILVSKIFAIYNAIAMVALVPIAGVYGAAIATGTAQNFKNFFIWWHVRDIARWTNLRAVAAMIGMVWVPCVAACLLIKRAAPDWPAAAHLAIGAILCALAALIYIRTPALSSSDRSILGSVFHGREGRVLEWFGIHRKVAAG